jgi:hypothetical protein
MRSSVLERGGLSLRMLLHGENHGGGHPGGNWYEVSEIFAMSWGQQRYSFRHLKVKNPGR